MNINVVFDLGLEIFDDYMKVKKPSGSNDFGQIKTYLNETQLSKYCQALNSYVVFEESNHSYIAAYMTANDASDYHAHSILCAIGQSQSRHCVEGSSVNQRERFIQIFYMQLCMNYLHVYPSFDAKREENAPSYSFFIEIMTCKEVKRLALVLLFAGMMSLLIGASSAVGIAATTTVLASIGVSATTAIIGGGITAAIGLGLRLFKPTDPFIKSKALEAHVMTEIEKGSSYVPMSQSMSRA